MTKHSRELVRYAIREMRLAELEIEQLRLVLKAIKEGRSDVSGNG